MESAKGKVLITGVNGFVGSYVAKLLLEAGYTVRGTVRDRNNKAKLGFLDSLPSSKNFELYEADLSVASTIDKAVEGCDYVMHVAAPVLPTGDEAMIVNPAVDGARFVMEAVIKHKVKKIVVTSSLVAIINMDVADKKIQDEEDWPNMDKPQASYTKAKVLSEKIVWDMYNKAPKETRPKLVVINPGLILGPTLTKTTFYSGSYISEALNGTLEKIPRMFHEIVDIRDVALAHVKALENPETDGQRYLCSSNDYLWVEDMVKILKEEFGKYGYKFEGKVIDECPDKSEGSVLNARWGRTFKVTNEKIKKALGIEFIQAKDSVIAMGYSMIKQGIVPDLMKK